MQVSSPLPLPGCRRRPAGGVAVAGLLWALLATTGPASAAIVPGTLAPDFTLKALDRPNLRLQELRGQVVMINFWATWCAPCREEMPELNKLHARFQPSGFTLLGVNLDEDSRQAAGLATQLGLKFPVLFDADKRVSRLYDLATMPSTVLLDRDGKVRFVHRGYRSGTEAEYERQIRALLKE